MSALADHVDRLSQLASNIRSSASAAARAQDVTHLSSTTSTGPFTRAILETPLGDLIRDIDPAELGLFTLVQPTQPGTSHAHTQDKPGGPSSGEIARVEFPGATPLKKPPAIRHGRDDPQRPREHEPEVYAQAALKYLDRYNSIRPMPRAAEQAEKIIQQLTVVRENIHSLTDRLQQINGSGASEPPLSPKSAVREEERRIHELQLEINELKRRKEALLKKKQTGIRSKAKLTAKPKAKPSSPSSPDAQEHSFWNTPAASARTLHFNDDLLTNEQMDLANVSAFTSPLVDTQPPRIRTLSRPGSRARHLTFTEPLEPEPSLEQDQMSLSAEADDTFQLDKVAHDAAEEDAPEAEIDEPAEEETIIFRKPMSPPIDVSPSPPPGPQPESPSPTKPSVEQSKKAKFRVTTEMENIVSKIWSTMGEVVMPGHPFDVLGTGGTRPPRAKETIAHLQNLSSQIISPGSPSTSSVSSLATAPPSTGEATSQQILIAHLLLALLSSPPGYAMPLNKAKELLASKSGEKGTAVTRPIYGCVAKRLLKIERGGGEQIVKFDV